MHRPHSDDQPLRPEPKPYGYLATDSAIPLNFMPLPQERDRDVDSADGDHAIDHTVARLAGWLLRMRMTVTWWRRQPPGAHPIRCCLNNDDAR